MNQIIRTVDAVAENAIATRLADPADFPVAMEDVFDSAGNRISGFKRVARLDTLGTLAVHTDSYKLVTHREVIDHFDAAIEASPLDRTDIAIRSDISHDGARLFRKYVFPAHRINIGRDGRVDEVDLQIVLKNSYDGTMSATFQAGGFRLICSNGLVIGKEIARAKSRHTNGFDIETLSSGLVSAVEAYTTEGERWRAWSLVPVTLKQAMLVFKSIPGSNEKMLGVLTETWADQSEHTLWTLYNVLTGWATHSEARANAAAARDARDERVGRVISAKVWKDLELTAEAA